VQASSNTTQGLVVGVMSLQRARAFLREKGLLGADSQRETSIDPSKIQGLDIRVVEQGR